MPFRCVPYRKMRLPAIFSLLAGLAAGSRGYAQDLDQIGKEKTLKVSGSIGGEGALNGQTGGAPVPGLGTYGLNANLNFSIYGWSIPFSATYYNRQFSYAQPFSRYGLSPRYKWLTLHGGWRSVSFSPLVFSGVNFLGGGIELNPGKFRFGAIYGQFNKAVAEDTGRNKISEFSTYTYPCYKRMGYALKLGYGTSKSYLDLVFFRAKDDTASIPRPESDRFRKPQQNTAGSLVYQQSIGKNMVFRFNTSVSLYTYDMQSDTLPAGFGIGFSENAESIHPLRLSTQPGYAGEASLAYKARHFDLKGSFRQLSPFYQSMGIYSRLQDLQEARLESAFRSKNRKFFGNAAISADRNNIAHTKIATTRRIQVQFTGNYAFTEKLNGNLGYHFYNMAQVKQYPGLPDTLMMATAMHNTNGGFTYTTTGMEATKTLLVSGSFQSGQAAGLNMGSNTYQNYFATVSESYMRIRAKLGLNGGLNFFGSKGYGFSTYSLGGTAGISKTVFKDQLSAGIAGGYYRNFSSQDDGNTLTAGMQIGYRPGRRHAFNLSGNYTLTNSAVSSFTVYRLQSTYGYTF